MITLLSAPSLYKHIKNNDIITGVKSYYLRYLISERDIVTINKLNFDKETLTRRSNGYFPLDLVSRSNNVPIMNYFIDRGISINNPTSNKRQMTPLLNAASTSSHDIMKLLIKKGANIEAETYTFRKTPIFFAVANCDITAYELLLSKNANIHHKDKFNRSVLYYVFNSKHPCYSLYFNLIKKGVDPNTKDGDGKTALEYLRGVRPEFSQHLGIIEKSLK